MTDDELKNLRKAIEDTLINSGEFTIFSVEPDYDGIGILWLDRPCIVTVLAAKVIEE